MSKMTGIPAYHFDQVAWEAGWTRPSADKKEIMTQNLADTQKWVIDGVSQALMESADTIIFLDYPRMTCIWRMIKRNIACGFRTRSEMPADCPDYRQLPFIFRVIWSFPKKQNPWILEEMDSMKSWKHIVHIRNNPELRSFIQSVTQEIK